MATADRRKVIREMVLAAAQRNSYQQEGKEGELYMAQSYLNGMGRALYLMTGHEPELRVTPDGAITKIVFLKREYNV